MYHSLISKSSRHYTVNFKWCFGFLWVYKVIQVNLEHTYTFSNLFNVQFLNCLCIPRYSKAEKTTYGSSSVFLVVFCTLSKVILNLEGPLDHMFDI